ncbi:hypothetical protein SH449x_003298 [Pirellulaceae bacterium SH449]
MNTPQSGDVPRKRNALAQAVSDQLNARGLTKCDLIDKAFPLSAAIGSVLLDKGSLTPSLAFRLTRLTGLSATFWINFSNQEKNGKSVSSETVQQPATLDCQYLAESLTSEAPTAECICEALSALECMSEQPEEITAALAQLTMRTNDPLLFKAALQLTVMGGPEICRTLAQAHLSNSNLLIAESALWTLYAIEPGQALWHAYDCYIQTGTPSEYRLIAEELLAFDAMSMQLGGATAGADQNDRAKNVEKTCCYVRSTIESRAGDPSIFNAPDYKQLHLVRAFTEFLASNDTTKRVEALKTLAPRDVAIGICAALLGVVDKDPTIRANSLALLRMRNQKLVVAHAERLLDDKDEDVKAVAARVLKSLGQRASS